MWHLWNQIGSRANNIGFRRDWFVGLSGYKRLGLAAWGLGWSGCVLAMGCRRFDEAADFGDLAADLGVLLENVGNLFNTLDDGGVVSVAENKPNLLQGELGVLPKEVHGDMPSLGDGLGAALTAHGLGCEVEVGCHSVDDSVGTRRDDPCGC